MPTDYGKFKISCWAVVGASEIVLDVVQASIEYSLNGIPSATMTLALGNNAYTNETSAASTQFESNLFGFREKILVYASMEQQDAVNTQPGNEIVREFEQTVVFEGFITGFGYQRSGAASVLSVSAEHWLSDLTASTMISASTHALMPGDLQASILQRSVVAGSRKAAGLMGSSWISKLPVSTDDLWSNGIKVIAQAGASSNALVQIDNQFNAGCTSGGRPNNQAALDALDRMSGTLKLRIDGGSNLISAINADLAAIFLDNFVGQTIWDCIISASANYMFAIAPQINKAIVMPFLPAISGTPFKRIDSSQISSVSISGDMPRTIRAVGILFFQNGALTGAPNDVRIDPNIGRYVADATCKGTVLFKQSPPWLSVGSTGGFSTGKDKILAPTSGLATATNPGGGAPTNLPSTSQNINDSKDLRDRYAKSVYGYEVLKGRQGTVTGPLRLDIGVGSYIEFELPQNLHQANSSPKYFRGIVVKVEINLDAQSANAATTYTVAYVRRKDEDEGKVITMDSHPIYQSMVPTELGMAMDI